MMDELRREIIKAADTCSSCGACQAVCPTYRATRREETSARAKLRLAAAVAREQVHNTAAIDEMLEACLLCGRCTQACPNRVDARLALEQARTLVRGTLKAGAIDRAMAEPHKLDRLMLAARLALPGDSGLLLRLASPKGLEKLPRPADKFFLEDSPRKVQGPAGAPRVALFTGCLANYLRPELARKAVDLLSRRYTVVIPPEQGCCGLMARSAGAVDTAAGLNLRNTAALAATDADMVVTVCSSCAYALKDLDLPPVREICQVLANGLDGLEATDDGEVLLHTPCHQTVGLGRPDDARHLLGNAGVRLVEASGADQCCGGGGLFSLNNAVLSEDIFAPRLRETVRSGAGTLATTCSGCYVQWRRGLPVAKKVCHPIELIA